MELTEKQKIKELREKTIELIKELPEGKRAHIDKDMLEALLFDEIVYNKDTNEKLKLPVWSGDFLKKIDLSEVSFEDVAWGLITEDTYDFPEDEYMEFMDEETYDEMEKILPKLSDGEEINYSGTNAKIDFTKSFDYKKLGYPNVLFCNFSSTDLSNNVVEAGNFFKCDLSNTGLKFDTSKMRRCYIMCSNLTNLDLNGVQLDFFKYMDGYEGLNDCVLTNTGVKVVFDYNSKYLNTNENAYKHFIVLDRIKVNICDLLPNIEGCYFNDRRVLTKEEIRELRETKLEELKTYKREFIAPFEEKFRKDNNIKL